MDKIKKKQLLQIFGPVGTQAERDLDPIGLTL
jgi:hypothetical protein